MKYLAKALSLNHFNLSLSTKNPDYYPGFELSSAFSKIFKKLDISEFETHSFHPIGFSRNILIIGAGASINAYKDSFTTDQIVPLIYQQLGVYNIIAGKRINRDKMMKFQDRLIEDILIDNKLCNNVAEKFLYDAFSQIGQVVDKSITLKQLLDKLQFEGALKILNSIIRTEDLSKKIADLLSYRYIPNLFYELVAHLFKHRFIDVIINLNFDEMLDNAIEDEMGDSDWIKITNDASCVKYEKAIIDGRLRVPIYIKPHGTISDINSLMYSVPQYLNQSSEVMELLDKIFDGECGKDRSIRTKQFNIISAGYSFNDVDILGVIYKNIRRNYSNQEKERILTRLYILNTSPVKALNNLRAKFISFFGSENMTDFFMEIDKILNNKNLIKYENISKKNVKAEIGNVESYTNFLNKNFKKMNKVRLVPLSKYQNNDYNLNHCFLKLFKEIQSFFNAPFVPSGPMRHLFNCQIFTDGYFGRIFRDLSPRGRARNVKYLLRDRAIANFVYDFLKFNGKIPLNVLTNDRVGKYYRLYKERHNNAQSIFDLIGKYFKSEIEVSDDFFFHKKYYDSCYSPSMTKREKVIIEKSVFKIIHKILLKINKDFDKTSIKRIFNNTVKEYPKYLHRIPYSGSHEINPRYYDNQHLKFKSFDSRNIINTNLSLTWHFFEFAVLKKDKWSVLDMFTYSGSALINLEKYSDDNPSHLKRLFDDRKDINLYHSIIDPVYFKLNGNYSRPQRVIEKLREISDSSDGKFESTLVEDLSNFHNMTLFGELLQGRYTPKFGIYFFNPPNKARVNPVWFSCDDCSEEFVPNNMFNLKALKSFVDTAKNKYDLNTYEI